MSKEDFFRRFRPIRGDVWYFSTKSIARGVGDFVYTAQNLGIRLIEEVVTPEPVPSASGSLRAVRGATPRAARCPGVGILDSVTLGYRGRNLGVRLVEEVDR